MCTKKVYGNAVVRLIWLKDIFPLCVCSAMSKMLKLNTKTKIDSE